MEFSMSSQISHDKLVGCVRSSRKTDEEWCSVKHKHQFSNVAEVQKKSLWGLLVNYEEAVEHCLKNWTKVDHEEIWEYLSFAEGLLWFMFVFFSWSERYTETVQICTASREPYGWNSRRNCTSQSLFLKLMLPT